MGARPFGLWIAQGHGLQLCTRPPELRTGILHRIRKGSGGRRGSGVCQRGRVRAVYCIGRNGSPPLRIPELDPDGLQHLIPVSPNGVDPGLSCPRKGLLGDSSPRAQELLPGCYKARQRAFRSGGMLSLAHRFRLPWSAHSSPRLGLPTRAPRPRFPGRALAGCLEFRPREGLLEVVQLALERQQVLQDILLSLRLPAPSIVAASVERPHV